MLSPQSVDDHTWKAYPQLGDIHLVQAAPHLIDAPVEPCMEPFGEGQKGRRKVVMLFAPQELVKLVQC